MDELKVDTRLVTASLIGATTLVTLAALETLYRKPRLGLGLVFVSILTGIGVYIYDALTE